MSRSNKAEIDATRKRMALSLDAQKNHHARQFILNTLAGDVSTEDLERIAKAMPFILQEAVRELNGEVLCESKRGCSRLCR